jgi:hypothetical protein
MATQLTPQMASQVAVTRWCSIMLIAFLRRIGVDPFELVNLSASIVLGWPNLRKVASGFSSLFLENFHEW